jgi:hypothetical protein
LQLENELNNLENPVSMSSNEEVQKLTAEREKLLYRIKILQQVKYLLPFIFINLPLFKPFRVLMKLEGNQLQTQQNPNQQMTTIN